MDMACAATRLAKEQLIENFSRYVNGPAISLPSIGYRAVKFFSLNLFFRRFL